MISIYYTELPTAIPGSFQIVLLLERAREKVGIVSCPKGGIFQKFSSENLDRFEEEFEDEFPSLVLNGEPSEELDEALALFSAEPGIVNVRFILDALKS